MSVDQVYPNSSKLSGRTVRAQEEGELKLFDEGYARIKFHNRGVLKLKAQVEQVHA